MIFALYNYDLWKIVKMEINHRSGDREEKIYITLFTFSMVRIETYFKSPLIAVKTI